MIDVKIKKCTMVTLLAVYPPLYKRIMKICAGEFVELYYAIGHKCQ
jgi:hypothetical protein